MFDPRNGCRAVTLKLIMSHLFLQSRFILIYVRTYQHSKGSGYQPVMMASVCPEPKSWIWSTASSMLLTISSVSVRFPYSCLGEGACFRFPISFTASFPPSTVMPAWSSCFCVRKALLVSCG